MIRDMKRMGNLGLGMVGGFSCGPDQHFAIGLMVWLYFPIVATCKNLGLARATDVVGFPVREEGG